MATISDARRLVDAVTHLGATPPARLTDLLDAYDVIANADTQSLNPTRDLVTAVIDGQLRGAELNKRIDAAAAELVKCAQRVDPHLDSVAFLEAADEADRNAWQSITPAVRTLSRIADVVTMFAPKSSTFPLVELPVQVGGTAVLDDVALMCVDTRFAIEQSSLAFGRTGVHRQSPWFLVASTLRLNSIDEARETVRAWAEKAWEALGLNEGRGVLDPEKGFIPTPIRNPFARKELAT